MTQPAQQPASRASKRALMLAVALAAVIAAVLIVTLSGGGGGKQNRHARGGAPGPAPAEAASQTQLAASYLGISKATLRQRLRKGETLAEIAESTPGRSSRELLHKLLAYRVAELRRRGLPAAQVREAGARLHARLTAELGRVRRIGATAPAAARYLGVSEAQLREQLRSGRTLAQVAASHGHTRARLIAALLAARRARLDMARRSGQITASEEQATFERLRRRVERAVDRRF